MTISNYPFLYNAESGKNNWWRYIITILVTIVTSFTATVVVGIILMIFFVMNLVQSGNIGSMDVQTQINNLIYNPIVLLLFTLVLYVFCFIVFYICARFIHRRKFISFINIDSKISWVKMIKGAVLWFFILGAFNLIAFVLNPGIYTFSFNPSAFAILFIMVIIGIPIQASFEEIFFRGYLMQGIGLLSKKPIIPLLVTSIIFAILHGANGTNFIVNIFIVIQTLIVGLMLGIIAIGENRIETAMGIHIANNMFAFLIVSSSDEVVGGLPSLFTTPPSTTPDLYVGVITTIIAVIIVLAIIFWGKKDQLMGIFRFKDAKNEVENENNSYQI